jgi:RimJ/RimL family protein N-acetyltransferase
MFARELDVSDYPHGDLRLVKPSVESAPLSLRWLRDPEVGQYMGADFSDVSIATEEKRVKDILSGNDVYGWSIELNGEVIGAVEINSIKESTQEYGVKTGNFSILIGDKSHWGKQIAPFAKMAIMSWAFNEGGFEQLIGKALTANERSWRSLERLGYKLQKTKPDVVNGLPAEWKVYMMTKADWENRAGSG